MSVHDLRNYDTVRAGSRMIAARIATPRQVADKMAARPAINQYVRLALADRQRRIALLAREALDILDGKRAA